MDILKTLWANYHWDLSLYAFVGNIAANLIAARLLVLLVPTIREAEGVNAQAFREKLKRPEYAQNQKWNRKWALLDQVVIFGLVLPFCLTLAPQPWWRMARDIVVILMVYDFFYYFTHRFVFHGSLKWVHAIHHRQHNPCRMDSSYIHPIEVVIGLGLYTATIFVLSRFMGNFHLATIIITWVAFTQINLHNHDLWQADRFPFRYLNYASRMHHNHHVKFTGGNFATISLLYDWMFGTLDYGKGGAGKSESPSAPARLAAE